MKHEDIKLDKKVVKKAIGMHDKQLHGGKSTNLTKLKKGGMSMNKKSKCYDEGGEIEFETKRIRPEESVIGDDVRARAMKAVAEGGQKDEAPKAKPRMKRVKKPNAMTESMSRMNPMGDTYKKGGSVSSASSRADGCAVRGKTKGRMV